jgi:hypothetical protein
VEGVVYDGENGTLRVLVRRSQPGQAAGFVRACVPRGLVNVSGVSVRVDGAPEAVAYVDLGLHDNGTHRWVYVAYRHSTVEITLISEYPTPWAIAVTVTIVTVFVVLRYVHTTKSSRTLISHQFEKHPNIKLR